MRVFLSHADERHIPPFPDEPCPGCLNVALGEALRIVAEVEPEPRGSDRFEVGVLDAVAGVVWFKGHGGEPFRGPNGHMTEDARALVEALQEFVS